MRLDHQVIFDWIEPGARVLDLGCGEGDLLAVLTAQKGIIGQGVEINEEAIYRCVEKGVSVFHSDIESGLGDFPDQSFDYTILNQSLQEVRNIGRVLDEALRIGKKAVVGIPNFAHLRARVRLFFRGMTPITPALPYSWAETPNIRFMSITDFKNFCRFKGYQILDAKFLGTHRRVLFWPNLFALNGIFLLTKAKHLV